MLRRNTARSPRAQLPELVGVDHRHELRLVRAEEEHFEASARCEADVHLRTRVAELEVRRRHHRHRSLLESEPVARTVLDGAARHALEACLDRGDRVRRREQPRNVVLAEVQGHEPDFLMKLIAPLVSITAQATSSS
jgi:hypothetical protein